MTQGQDQDARLREAMGSSAGIETALQHCRWCGCNHGARRCPTVKRIEYYPDGTTPRSVEFFSLAEIQAAHPVQSVEYPSASDWRLRATLPWRPESGAGTY